MSSRAVSVGQQPALIERLKDPATRLRIRKDLLTPSKDWDNEWQEIPGPEAIMIGVVQNPKMLSLQGKRLSEVAKFWDKDPIDALFDFLIEDPYAGVAVFGMSNLMSRSPCSSRGSLSTTTLPELRRRVFSARSIRTRALMALSRAFCASTSEKKSFDARRRYP